MTSSVGERVKQAYVQAGLNRNQFAKKLGTVYHNVIRWESGATPGPEYLSKISEITGVSVDWLLNGEERVDRDEGHGYPEIDAYLADMERAGTPVAPEHVSKLRTWRRALGPVEREEIVGYHRGMIAADARKALERPIDERARVDEERGQRKLPPVKRRGR